MRLDKYLKVSRLIKRRTVANEACDSGRVLINDKPAKASTNVREGDIITISFGNKEVKVEVLDVQVRGCEGRGGCGGIRLSDYCGETAEDAGR